MLPKVVARSLTFATAAVTNSTIAENFATQGGGGIYNSFIDANNFAIKSSIIALNTGPEPDASGSFVTGGFNLIGKRNGSRGFSASTDQTGTVAAPLDPRLDPNGLQNNGGPTQ